MNAFVSVQTLASTTHGNIQAFQSLAEIMLGATEQALAINLDTARKLCSGLSAAAEPLAHSDVQGQFAAPINAQTQAFEQTAAYVRNLAELSLRVQNDLAGFGTERFAEATRGFCELCDKLAHAAPQGSGDFLAAMKQVITQSSAAYETLVRTSREAAESTLAAASKSFPAVAANSASTAKASRKTA